jgi:YVTN family beta-propeller protein
VTTIRVPVSGPVSVAAGAGAVWVAGQGSIASDAIPPSALVRIDPRTRRVADGPIKISPFLGSATLAVAPSGQVWVGHREFRKGRALRALDPATGRFGRPVDAGPDIVGVALARDAVWALDFGGWPGARRYRGGVAIKVDPRTHRVVARVRVGRAPSALAIGAGGVWATNNLDGTVTRIDTRSARVAATIAVGRQPTGISAGAGGVWVANNVDGTLSRIDPATNTVVQTIPVGTRPRGVAVAADGSVWVANSVDDTISRVDPTQGKVTEAVPVGAGPAGVAIGQGAIWVANNLDGTVTRVEPSAAPLGRVKRSTNP